MRVMVFVKATEDSEQGFFPTDWTTGMLEAMGRFNDELRKAGILLAADGLMPSTHGKRVAFNGADRTIVDGPFAEPRTLVAGYWLWEVRDMDEALRLYFWASMASRTAGSASWWMPTRTSSPPASRRSSSTCR